jgi:hypothetical protein
MNRHLENLKIRISEDPVAAMGTAATLISSIGLLVNARGNARNSKTWRKEVDRRIKKTP